MASSGWLEHSVVPVVSLFSPHKYNTSCGNHPLCPPSWTQITLTKTCLVQSVKQSLKTGTSMTWNESNLAPLPIPNYSPLSHLLLQPGKCWGQPGAGPILPKHEAMEWVLPSVSCCESPWETSGASTCLQAGHLAWCHLVHGMENSLLSQTHRQADRDTWNTMPAWTYSGWHVGAVGGSCGTKFVYLMPWLASLNPKVQDSLSHCQDIWGSLPRKRKDDELWARDQRNRDPLESFDSIQGKDQGG